MGYTPQGSKELDTTEQLHFTFNNLQSEASFLIFLAFGVLQYHCQTVTQLSVALSVFSFFIFRSSSYI